MSNPRWLAYAILRVTVGGVFLFYGIGKFVAGLAATAKWFQDGFAKTWLPAASVYAFSIVLPFFEVTVGALLILGLFTRFAASAAGLLIAALTIGLTIKGNSADVALNMGYAVALFILLHRVEDNGLSIDGWRKH
ncbi:MAG: DoxX family protein [Candidatus Solibacter usitatus]|nr:DoxX family protein [Candidatus Solibacter usitatus]